MNKRESYEKKLVNLSPRQWETFLKKHSNLPGPRANLELAEAFSRIGTLMDFKKYIQLDYKEAPENTPDEFLTFCGVLGLGEYLAKYHDAGLLQKLKERANDPRSRIRKSVRLALQAIGHKDIGRLIHYLKLWAKGSCLEQHVAITALCDEDLLNDPEVCLEVFELLDWITASMVEEDMDKVEGYKELKRALSYCWSVAVAMSPEKGKPVMGRWIKENHPVINNIMRGNLEKERLSKMDPEWTNYWLQELSD